MSQKATIKRVDDNTDKNSRKPDIFWLCESLNELQRAAKLSIPTMQLALEALEQCGSTAYDVITALKDMIGLSQKAFDRSQQVWKGLPIIQYPEPKISWGVRMQLYANERPCEGAMTETPVDSLEAAIKWNSDMLDACEKSAKDAGWEVLERGFDKRTGNGFLRHRHDGVVFRTRYRTIKNGKIYEGE